MWFGGRKKNWGFRLHTVFSAGKNFERLHGNETGIKNVGIGPVMSLFFLW
jgi:hypothetical protein